MPVYGSGANQVLLVGDFPHGPTKHLHSVLSRAGLTLDQFWFSPDLYPPSVDAKAVVLMGEAGLRQKFGETDIIRWRGRYLKQNNLWVIPTLHPRELQAFRGKHKWNQEKKEFRDPARLTGAVLWDLHQALRVAKHGFMRKPTTYWQDPLPDVFSGWANDCEDHFIGGLADFLSWDIETPYKLKKKDEEEQDIADQDKAILRVSFAFKSCEAISVPWDGPYIATIRRLLKLAVPKTGWNVTGFDLPLVQSQGFEVNGTTCDGMWAWHVLQSDLPMGLEFVSSFATDLLPWKHLSDAEPALYSCIDADAGLRNMLWLKDRLIQTGQWELYKKHSVLLDPILKEAGERGNCIDVVAQNALGEILTAEKAKLHAAAQQQVPDALKGFSPKEGYTRDPKDLTGLVSMQVEAEVKVCSVCREITTNKSHFKKKTPCEKGVYETVRRTVNRWAKQVPFNPGSSDQMKNYMKFFKHPLGRNKDTGEESADKAHLKKLQKRFGHKHPIYATAIEWSKVNKADGTYVKGFAPDENGLIHTTFTNAPSTWRLSSRNVNMQNVGKREENLYAKEARKAIVARPNHIFVQADSSAIEAVFTGYFVGSKRYIDLAVEGIHDYVTCMELGLKWPDEKKRCKSEFGEIRERNKKAVHLTNYGGTPKMIQMMAPDTFPTLGDAAKAQQTYLNVFPELAEWHHKIRVRAHEETYLKNPWGHRHYFYDIFKVDGQGNVGLGNDAKRAIAYLPQSSAGCFARDNLLLLGASPWRQFMCANVTVHDSYCLDVPENYAEEAIDYLAQLLTRHIWEMGGLRVGAEIEVGKNWASFDPKKNPEGMKSVMLVGADNSEFKLAA